MLDTETAASEIYRTLVDVAGNLVTEDLTITLLTDKEAHRTEFRGFKKGTATIQSGPTN